MHNFCNLTYHDNKQQGIAAMCFIYLVVNLQRIVSQERIKLQLTLIDLIEAGKLILSKI